ncbi:MAG: 4Fe-4S binding protein [Bauldia sp.]
MRLVRWRGAAARLRSGALLLRARAVLASILIFIGLLPTVAHAADYKPQPLATRTAGEMLTAIFPGAERVGPVEGNPPSAPVFKGDKQLGWVFSTYDIVRAPGYSGVPFDVVAGVTTDGEITGAKVIYNLEPHIVGDARRAKTLDEFLSLQAKTNVRSDARQGPPPNMVGGASVSARSMRDAIQDSARIILRQHSPRAPVTEPTLDVEGFRPATYADLLASGAVVRRVVTNAEVKAMYDAAGWKLELDAAGPPDRVYADFFAALVTPASIGINLIGSRPYTDFIAKQPPGTNVVVIASAGPYDIMGSSYLHRDEGYRFDRIRVVQGDKTFTLVRDQYQRVPYFANGPVTNYVSLFRLAADSGFDPLKPWRVDLLINGTNKADKKVSVPVDLAYKLPAAYVLMPDPVPVPAYVEAWSEAKLNVAILCAALAVLTLILLFQNELTKRRGLFRIVRTSFLVFTLGWLGWTVGAQLSTLHLVNYMGAPFKGFDIGFYLTEPLIVIISLYTIVSLIALGRGVFCGWLCPFGALQELLAHVSRFLRLPQWNPPDWLNRKLWLLKYLAAALVIVLGFLSPDSASKAQEVEPFKTAITSMFTRPWPYEIYAAFIIALGLFTERAYCRYLCPLGGTLALLDRLHLVDALKRRAECGSPCQLCAHSCPVKAIVPSGEIKMAECFQCLDCQVEYHDDHRCPPLVRARKHGIRAAGTIFTTPKNRPAGVPVAASIAAGAAEGSATA